MLVIINLPLIGIWVKLLKVPYRMMFPAILIFCCIGIYSVNNAMENVLSTAFFTLVGYLLINLVTSQRHAAWFRSRKLMEEKFRQAMILSRGSFMTFVERPVSAVLAGDRASAACDRGPAIHPQEARRGLRRIATLGPAFLLVYKPKVTGRPLCGPLLCAISSPVRTGGSGMPGFLEVFDMKRLLVAGQLALLL